MARKLYFNYGPMGSAKTLKLLTMAYNLEEKGIQFVVFKPSIDNRDGINVVKSRIGIERECTPISQEVDIYEVVSKYATVLEAINQKLEWILIDECQFLTVEQVNQLGRIADLLDIDVMCFGLRTDFQSNLFPASKRLFEIADNIEEIKIRCSCGRKAIINARFNNDEIVLDGNQVMIGGDDTYKSFCRKCYNDLIFKNTKE